MKLLLLGCNGQVGWELQRALSPLGQIIALDRHAAEHGGDLSKPQELCASVRRIAPDIIVNAAAYTTVDKAESERQQCRLINAEAVAALAQEVASLNGWLVHYSTDYVFDGSGDQPWREDDETGPLNHYGQTKLEGEQAIHASGCRHLIFRTSWVYALYGSNFPKTMLKLASERKILKVIHDQFGAPTGAELIADVTAQALHHSLQYPQCTGIYHLAARGVTNWHEYAEFVVDQTRKLSMPLQVESIEAVASSEYPTAARRPANSRLDTSKLCATFGLQMPDWRQGVQRLIQEMRKTT